MLTVRSHWVRQHLLRSRGTTDTERTAGTYSDVTFTHASDGGTTTGNVTATLDVSVRTLLA